MSQYQNVRESTTETRTLREDVVTSVRVLPPAQQIDRSAIHANDPPTQKIYRSELLFTLKPVKHTFDNCQKCGGLIDRQCDDGVKRNNENYHRQCAPTPTFRTIPIKTTHVPLTTRNPVVPTKSCVACHRSLADQVVPRVLDSESYCNDCYNDKTAPQCYACAKPIGAGHYTTYKGNQYHSDCFKCYSCDQVIRELEFPSHNNNPCCERCFEKKFAARCHECGKAITSIRSIVYEDNKYHPECFCCVKCLQPINEMQFHMHDGKPCCKKCFQEHFEAQCEQCHNPITSGRSVNYNGKTYHPNCFLCGKCERVIHEQRFFKANDKPCCNDCHEQHFTTKCTACQRTIIDRYTTYKGQPYHPYCFVCTKCRRIIDSTEKFYDEPNGALCMQCGK